MINLFIDIHLMCIRKHWGFFSFRVAVVTGGNRGIGLEICRQLASKGVTVVLTARDEKRGAETVKNLAAQGLSNVLFHPLEVGDLSSAVRLADFIREQYGKLDILVLARVSFPTSRVHVKDVVSEFILNHMLVVTGLILWFFAGQQCRNRRDDNRDQRPRIF